MLCKHLLYDLQAIYSVFYIKSVGNGYVNLLVEEFLNPLEISAYRLSKDINIPQTRISEIIKGKRRMTADTALRLSKYFGNSPKFWLGLQDDYDLEEEILSNKKLNSIQAYNAA